MAYPLFCHAIDDRHLVRLHELVKHLLVGKCAVVLKDLLQQRVMHNLASVVFAIDTSLLDDFLLYCHDQLKEFFQTCFLGKLVLNLRVDRLSTLDGVNAGCELNRLMCRSPLLFDLEQLAQVVEFRLI